MDVLLPFCRRSANYRVAVSNAVQDVATEFNKVDTVAHSDLTESAILSGRESTSPSRCVGATVQKTHYTVVCTTGMETAPLSSEDEALIERLIETNERTFDPEFFDGAHVVTAGVRMADGSVYEGVSLPASVGRASMCGEPVAVGSAIADGYSHDDIRTSVAVAYPMPSHDANEARVIPPCGSCRELLADYNEKMRVIVPVNGETRVVSEINLLPTRPW